MVQTGCNIVAAMREMRPMSMKQCLVCKGSRMLCGYSSCPLLQKVYAQFSKEGKISQEIYGPSPPSLFVGHYGYPNISIGPSIAFDNEGLIDDPREWYGKDIDEIIRARYSTVRSMAKENIYSRDKVVRDTQELAMATKPADLEVEFEKTPKYSLSFSAVNQPMGPVGRLKHFRIATNTKIPSIVEYVINDELKAADSSYILFNKGFDVHYLTKILSAGTLGVKDKRIVPTRWSITAIDDIIGKRLMKNVKEYETINQPLLYHNRYLDNNFNILLLPGSWEFEMFEAWAPGTLWTLAFDEPAINYEYEPNSGRTTYATQEGGAYYAARFAVLEALNRTKQQARVIIFREIYENYTVPVGVWEVRENVRRAMSKKPLKFDKLSDALELLRTSQRIRLDVYTKRSTILRQRKLSDFS